MTIAEWIGTAAMLAAPYLVIGVVWSVAHDWSFGAIVWWPVQLASAMCLA